jgi:hypothetical protein
LSGDEIRVAEGIYKPDEDSDHPNGTGYRAATFKLKNGVSIRGGYAGFGERDADAHDIDLYEAILSGDLNGDDGPNFANNSENSYHVLTGSGTNATAALVGFTITGGNANSGTSLPEDDSGGGGMFNFGGSPTVRYCKFDKNSAMYGGGICQGFDSSLLSNCIFSGNSGWRGGGLYTYESQAIVRNCIFIGNSASNDGGGIINYFQSPRLFNCTLTGNTAGKRGGGIYDYMSGSRLTNCIFWGNRDESGMGESSQFRNYEGGPFVINYCCIQGWTGALRGIGNIGDNPLLAPGNYHLEYGSPCIDAGDPTGYYHGQTDIDGQHRVMGGRVDIGADEYEPATMVGLEIMGPNDVAENFSANYKAILHFDNNSIADVTNLVNWSVEPNTYASVDENGMLATKDVFSDRSVTILASYTDGDVTVDAEKPIHIFPICPTGTALQFDGVNDYVDVGDPVDGSLDFGAGDSFSISAWIKPIGNATIIINKMRIPGGTFREGYFIRISYNQIQFYIEDTGGAGSSIIGNTKLEDGNWYHVVGVRDTAEDKLYVYVNGLSDTTPVTDTTTTTLATTQDFWIGRMPYYNYFFDGTIDDVRIYDRALSAEEIQANMHTRLAGDEPGLVGYWGFDEGGGQIVYDLSGNGNDGQLGSTPNPDVSDPARVESDVPVGICSLYQITTMAIERAIERKTALLEELLTTLADEWTVYVALEELLESGDYDDLNKGDIVTAKQKVHSAIQHEEQSIDALEKSIEKLKDALRALGYVYKPPNVTIMKPQDGAVFGASEKIEIEANAWDVDGLVMKVEFFANGSKIGEDNDGTDGWRTNWYDHPVGTYSLTAKATDDYGAATTSPVVGITVLEVPLPGQAINPNPADGATGIGITADLSWTAGLYATSHDLYFGTSSPPPFINNQTATTFDPGTMTADITYYWRIDEVNPSGTTTGTVWSFTTVSPPSQAINPNPADGATGVSTTADLSWTAGSNAVSHDVYFGTTSPGTFRGNQTSTIFDPGTMNTYTTYYWRIDEVNASGTTTGTVWTLRTAGSWPPV